MKHPFLFTQAATGLASAVGGLGTRPESAWYSALDKPPWQPPPAAFGLVWTPVYGLIAWGTGRLLRQAGSSVGVNPAERRLAALTVANLSVNAGWNWAFFARESAAGGLAVIGILDLLNLALWREALRRDRTAAVLLTPYVVWTGFATALNASIWRRNR